MAWVELQYGEDRYKIGFRAAPISPRTAKEWRARLHALAIHNSVDMVLDELREQPRDLIERWTEVEELEKVNGRFSEEWHATVRILK